MTEAKCPPHNMQQVTEEMPQYLLRNGVREFVGNRPVLVMRCADCDEKGSTK